MLLPLIARDLWYSGEAAASGSAERRRQLALERLAAWNGEMSEHAPEPLVYAAWMRHLKRRLAQDELGPMAALVPVPDPVFIERVYRNVDGAGAWCDVRQTTAVETCTEMSRLALDDALVELEEAYGSAARELALGRRAPGAAPPPDARRRAAAAAPRQHPPVDAGRRPHAAARADRPGSGPSPTSTSTPPGSAPSSTSPTRTRACSSSRPARAGTCCRATTTTSRRSGGGPTISRCRSIRRWRGPGRSASTRLVPAEPADERRRARRG